jgi:hypothetical protein
MRSIYNQEGEVLTYSLRQMTLIQCLRRTGQMRQQEFTVQPPCSTPDKPVDGHLLGQERRRRNVPGAWRFKRCRRERGTWRDVEY